jgi:hypothetical protein
MCEELIFEVDNSDKPSAFFPKFSELKDYEDPSTGHAIVLGQIKDWLHDCNSDHRNPCVLENVPLPTRLLDISSLSSGGDPMLCITKGARGRYMCLSHCWGKTHPLRTTRATLESHLQGIPILQLPKTFRDMIAVAQFLEIDYLWIDSICIIQDDVDDWTKEAGLMASIYENSFVTLCATASENSQGGLFKTLLRTESPFYARQVPIALPTQKDPQIWYRHIISHNGLYNLRGDAYQDAFMLSQGLAFPLFSRAWTLQETILSPRVLHFTDWEVVWHCDHGMKCCCSDESSHDQDSTIRRRLRHPNSFTHPSYWRQFIEMYSARKLAKPTDRLTALSGVARKVQRAREDDYLAGMWRDRLLDDLLWEMIQPGESKETLYIAPSWSWASANAAVRFDQDSIRRDEDAMQVRDAYCSVDERDPTGAVTDGHLRVYGAVAACRVQQQPRKYPTNITLSVQPIGTSFNLDLQLSASTRFSESEFTVHKVLVIGSGHHIGERKHFMILEHVRGDQYRRLEIASSAGNNNRRIIREAFTKQEITII